MSVSTPEPTIPDSNEINSRVKRLSLDELDTDAQQSQRFIDALLSDREIADGISRLDVMMAKIRLFPEWQAFVSTASLGSVQGFLSDSQGERETIFATTLTQLSLVTSRLITSLVPAQRLTVALLNSVGRSQKTLGTSQFETYRNYLEAERRTLDIIQEGLRGVLSTVQMIQGIAYSRSQMRKIDQQLKVSEATGATISGLERSTRNLYRATIVLLVLTGAVLIFSGLVFFHL
jgi:hypothetical protein